MYIVKEGCDSVRFNITMKIILAIASLFFWMAPVKAANVKLAVINGEINNYDATVELWGDRKSGNYADKLIIFLKDKNGNLLAAYGPSITGGYGCFLNFVSVDGKNDQVLVAVGRGNWQADTDFRIVDFSDLTQVREVFTDTDNSGVVQKTWFAENELVIDLINGEENSIGLTPEQFQNIISTERDPIYGRIFSLTVCDLDHDGSDELLTVQKISAAGRELADVGTVWKMDNDEWQKGGYAVLVTGGVKNNTINDGAEGVGYTVVPRKIVLGGREATYPLIAYYSDAELQNRLNEILRQECDAYLQEFYRGEADMAFNVLVANKSMLSVQFISGKDTFIHHNVHIDPTTGRKIKLSDLLDTKQPDLIKLLNLLNANKNVQINTPLPDEWCIDDDKLLLFQTVNGKEEISGFALGNLHKFIKSRKFIKNKN